MYSVPPIALTIFFKICKFVTTLYNLKTDLIEQFISICTKTVGSCPSVFLHNKLHEFYIGIFPWENHDFKHNNDLSPNDLISTQNLPMVEV